MKRGWQSCLVVLVVLSVATLPALAAGKGSTSGLNCKVLDATPGIASDGNANYNHGSTNTSVKCFLGAGGKNFDLVTYNTGRTLKLSFAPGADQAVATLATLPATVNAEVDAFGINFYSQYLNMAVGTTAQVQMDLEFHYGGGSTTYELSYSCLAVTRTQFTTWVITSVANGSNEYAVPCISSKAMLNKIRRNTVQGFGEVTMPVTFEFSPQ